MPADVSANVTHGNERGMTTEKLALIIPTLNEAANLPSLLARVDSILEGVGIPYEVIVVDDDSRDGTEEVVRAITASHPCVRLLVRKGERGLSGAILHGWMNTDATILGVMDADHQHPPELLPSLIRKSLEGHCLVIGSRYVRGGELGNWNASRKFLSSAAVWVTWPIQRHGLRAKDPMSGFFLVQRKSIAQLQFQKSGFKLLLEILVRGKLKTVREVPIHFGLRNAGTSKASARIAWQYGRLLMRLYNLRFGFGKN